MELWGLFEMAENTLVTVVITKYMYYLCIIHKGHNTVVTYNNLCITIYANDNDLMVITLISGVIFRQIYFPTILNRGHLSKGNPEKIPERFRTLWN